MRSKRSASRETPPERAVPTVPAEAGLRSAASTVKNLQELYTVAVGIALAWGIEQLAGKGGGGQAAAQEVINWGALPAFVAFLVTLVPFYHGALRHLEHTYVEDRGLDVRKGSLLADFFLLFLEGCLFVLAAKFVADPRTLGLILSTLLVFDALWGLAVYLLFTKGRRRWAELRWVQINIVAGPLLAVAVFGIAPTRSPATDLTVAVTIAVIAALRTVVDYWLSWGFYFPEDAP